MVLFRFPFLRKNAFSCAQVGIYKNRRAPYAYKNENKCTYQHVFSNFYPINNTPRKFLVHLISRKSLTCKRTRTSTRTNSRLTYLKLEHSHISTFLLLNSVRRLINFWSKRALRFHRSRLSCFLFRCGIAYYHVVYSCPDGLRGIFC